MSIIKLAAIPTLRSLYETITIPSTKPRVTIYFSWKSVVDLKAPDSQGDITILEIDAIVNAANETLLGGGGVDGAIHFAAGKQLLEECATLGGAETGEAKITKGYNLPAKHVIHTVGPIYSPDRVEIVSEQLASCYRSSLALAANNSLKSIAFCSISTSIFSYPIADATHIALKVTREYLDANDYEFERIVFVVYSDTDRDVYRELLPLYFPPTDGSNE